MQKSILKYALLLTILHAVRPSAIAQDCHCTIKQVMSNTVAPCTKLVGLVDTVYSTAEFRSAINMANQRGGDMTILLANGTYPIASTDWYPYIRASNVVFRSLSGMRDSVVITGQGMKDVAPKTEIGIFAVGDSITIADLTIKEVGNHGIAATGEHLLVHNVRIQNTFEQMIKGTSADDGADSAVVQCSLFEYPAGIGPQFYIGGLDIHNGDYWLVRDNIFRNIISPSKQVAEHAVHFWNSSSNNVVERNWIVNCDRGIGFGLGSSSNSGGIIRNNIIYNDGTGQFDDVGIGLETSPNTKVYNNTIHIQYSSAIEYRFAATDNVLITNNLCNKRIRLREGASASLAANIVSVDDNWFENLESGNLRLKQEVVQLVDKGLDLGADLTDDIDQRSRPQGKAVDIGAHEYPMMTNVHTSDASPQVRLIPNPATGYFVLKSTRHSSQTAHVQVLDLAGALVADLFVIEGERTKVTLQPALYLVRIELKDKVYFQKLVVEK